MSEETAQIEASISDADAANEFDTETSEQPAEVVAGIIIHD